MLCHCWSVGVFPDRIRTCKPRVPPGWLDSSAESENFLPVPAMATEPSLSRLFFYFIFYLFGLVFDKRVIDPDTKISYPFGYRVWSECDQENVDILLDL